MTTSSRSDPRHLIDLAERMGIPADDAIRQVAQLIDRPGPMAGEPEVEPEAEPMVEVVGALPSPVVA